MKKVIFFTFFLFTSYIINATAQKKIEPPNNINITANDNEITLSWKNSDKSNKTEIYYSTNPKKANKENGNLLIKATAKEFYKFALSDEDLKYYAFYSKKGLNYSEKKVLFLKPSLKLGKIIHFHNDPEWQKVKIKIYDDSSKSDKEFDMNYEKEKWYIYKTDTSSREIKFSFVSDIDKFHKNYLDYFKSSINEIWVKNGVIFDYNPDIEKQKENITAITVNLHTYQEKDSYEKLLKVAETINSIDADFIFLQECGQNKDSKLQNNAYLLNGSDEIKSDNAAYIITRELNEKYNKKYKFLWSWAHYGWNNWEEGVALLTRDTVLEGEARYVSSSSSRSVIDSRKVVYLKIKDKHDRIFNLFSVHLSYNTDKYKPQKKQIDNFLNFVNEKSTIEETSLIGGDFNMHPTDEGYFQVVSPDNKNILLDSYYYTNCTGFLDNSMIGGKRIDYIFYQKESKVYPTTAQFIFREGEKYPAGRVSDHYGMIVNFKVD